MQFNGFVARGYRRFGSDWDWAGAGSDFKHALELSPKSSLALDAYNKFLRTRGRSQEAIAASEAALRNDPLSPGLHAGMGTTLLMAHRFEEAIPRFKEASALDPNFGTALTGLAWCYLWTGRGEGRRPFGLGRQRRRPRRAGKGLRGKGRDLGFAERESALGRTTGSTALPGVGQESRSGRKGKVSASGPPAPALPPSSPGTDSRCLRFLTPIPPSSLHCPSDLPPLSLRLGTERGRRDNEGGRRDDGGTSVMSRLCKLEVPDCPRTGHAAAVVS
jgi:Tetratricopeptide repeat